MITITVRVNGIFLNTYRADGLIISISHRFNSLQPQRRRTYTLALG
ncbi:MAG: hypothetical protein MZV63_54695 [Marinilabiliales bacterium]|nr:hypothetical protein [Marinilabiliales bacterium]